MARESLLILLRGSQPGGLRRNVEFVSYLDFVMTLAA